MRGRSSCFVIVLSIVGFVGASLENAAHAGVISTQSYLSAVDRQAAIQRVDAVLARADVQRELEQLGVDPDEALVRVDALSDQELATLADNLEDLPAGGSLLGVVGVVFVVLLILELVGVIDIFKKI